MWLLYLYYYYYYYYYYYCCSYSNLVKLCVLGLSGVWKFSISYLHQQTLWCSKMRIPSSPCHLLSDASNRAGIGPLLFPMITNDLRNIIKQHRYCLSAGNIDLSRWQIILLQSKIEIKLFYSVTTVAYNYRLSSAVACFGLFQTIFGPLFPSRRYSRCALYIMGSHDVYRCVKAIIFFYLKRCWTGCSVSKILCRCLLSVMKVLTS
jgi:hypothetical protein